MSPKRATDLVKGIIVDLDAALASNGEQKLDERHSALASAMMLGVRLLGGMSINMARIATTLEKIHECQVSEREDGLGHGRTVADGGTVQEADQEAG